MPFRIPSALVAVAGAIALVTLLTVGDMLEGRTPQIVATVSVAPMLAAVFASPRWVAVVGVYTVGAMVLHGEMHGFADTQAQRVRIVAGLLAALLAVLVADRRRREQDQAVQWRSVAQVAQRTVLAEIPSRIGHAEVAVRYASAHSLARIGGDFYEVLETPFGIRALIGDVRGKGLDAVRLAAQCLGSFRESAFRDADPADVVRAMDAAVSRVADLEDFVTALLVEIGWDSTLTVVGAGHPDPLLVRDGEIEEIPAVRAVPLGLGTVPGAWRGRLTGGARLLLYTDGAAEASRHGEVFPLAAAVAATAASAGSLQDWLEGLAARLRAFTAGRLADDVALLALRLAPDRAPGPAGGPLLMAERRG